MLRKPQLRSQICNQPSSPIFDQVEGKSLKKTSILSTEGKLKTA
jgi:hypothetical protein